MEYTTTFDIGDKYIYIEIDVKGDTKLSPKFYIERETGIVSLGNYNAGRSLSEYRDLLESLYEDDSIHAIVNNLLGKDKEELVKSQFFNYYDMLHNLCVYHFHHESECNKEVEIDYED